MYGINMKKLIFILLFTSLFLAGGVGGYYYFSKVFTKEAPPVKKEEVITQPGTEDLFTLKIYYPAGTRLLIEDRRLQRKTTQIATAQATMEEFLKGPSGMRMSNVPKDVKVLGIYREAEKILYVDLSEQFRRNFQGDALTEYLLLKGLYESLISNVPNIEDIKILIEGREIETLGGHIYLYYPLKNVVAHEYE